MIKNAVAARRARSAVAEYGSVPERNRCDYFMIVIFLR